MSPLDTRTRTLLAMAVMAATTASVAARAAASEIGISGGSRGLAIHDAGEVLRDYCSRDAQDRLWLTLPGGARFELVTSTSDPAITNPGDGAFHAFDAGEVRNALAAVRFPLGAVTADVYILPYPRRSGLESAAGAGIIFLSPGVRPLSAEQQHSEFVHELGHVTQYALMPDYDTGTWQTYRRLRGIEDVSTYSASGPHADRPHEIFAEDFRALFGGALANSTGTIENSTLRPPGQVPGLESFMMGLQAGPLVARIAATPNPSRGAVHFARPAGVSAALELFDAAGRRIASLEPFGTEWIWDGRDAAGRPVVGVIFARVRGAATRVARVTVVP